MEPLLLRVHEAAKAIGLGRSKTYELVASGVLPSVRLGRSIRVPAQAVREFVARLIAEQIGSNGVVGDRL